MLGYAGCEIVSTNLSLTDSDWLKWYSQFARQLSQPISASQLARRAQPAWRYTHLSTIICLVEGIVPSLIRLGTISLYNKEIGRIRTKTLLC